MFGVFLVKQELALKDAGKNTANRRNTETKKKFKMFSFLLIKSTKMEGDIVMFYLECFVYILQCRKKKWRINYANRNNQLFVPLNILFILNVLSAILLGEKIKT